MANYTSVHFYQNIEQQYGTETKLLLKDYARVTKKLGSMISRKVFLIRCRKRGVFPVHIANNFKFVFPLMEENGPYTRKLSKCINRFKKAVLNIEIQHTFFKLKCLQQQKEALSVKIQSSSISTQIQMSFFNSQNSFHDKHVREKSTKTKSKFNNIIRKCQESSNSQTPQGNPKALYNGTSKQIPPQMEVLLSLGPNFALPSCKIDKIVFFHLIAEIENILKTNTDTAVQDRTRCSITNSVLNHIYHNNHTNQTDHCLQFYNDAVKITKTFLKENPDVLVTKSDKGNKTVLISKDDYQTKMMQLLDSQQTYQKISRDPTSRYQQKNNNIVQRLLNLKLIDKKTALKLSTHNAVCPRIYGQPKAHKAGLPLRPVVPNMTAPSYQLSKYVSKIIQNSTNSQYNIKDSFTFCEYINTVKLPIGYVLISLDVTSLFTSIPKALVIHDIINNWTNIDKHTDINLDLFLEIVEFCIDSSYFKYNNQHYQQLDGTAMGNPLSPALADLVMENLLDSVCRLLDFKPPFIRKYVDDLILTIPPDKIQHVLNTFNSHHPNIQFTYELEVDRRLPFLDMLLIRTADQSVKTQWYIKPISSGRFLDYNSQHPLHQKLNVAKNFINRVNKLSTNPDKAEVIAIVEKQLSLNSYPKALRRRLINRMDEHCSIIPTSEPNDSRTTAENLQYTYHSIAYIPNLSNKINKQLKKEYPNIKLATYNTNTVKKLFSNIKDPIPTDHHSNVIYSIPCKDCDACYIGLTTNRLKTRLSGHKTHYNALEKLLTPQDNTECIPVETQIAALKEKTALMDHTITLNHRFDFNSTKIIDKHNKQHSLPYLEMCHIVSNENSINKRTDTQGLSIIYAGVLHTLKNVNNHRSE
ncbi:uncharacterized protein LOC128732703 [Sabethes cyaneus]|uniref:uncharacterized protein LOC128732703 n=1 Tax=Sabethes cyaneus TaxID=53552 RepID=UPI00237D8CC2|nr:uncharacterized protein LOC128732703 [Sabethes cyaneus]